jgi:hypothetical protein
MVTRLRVTAIQAYIDLLISESEVSQHQVEFADLYQVASGEHRLTRCRSTSQPRRHLWDRQA